MSPKFWRERVVNNWKGGAVRWALARGLGLQAGERLCAAPPGVLADVMGPRAPEADPDRVVPKVMLPAQAEGAS